MARWLFLFAEDKFEVKYKLGKPNMLADALSLYPDYELAYLKTLSSTLEELIRVAYPLYYQCVHCFMPLVVTRTDTRKHFCRHGCVTVYIDIPSTKFSCAIAQR